MLHCDMNIGVTMRDWKVTAEPWVGKLEAMVSREVMTHLRPLVTRKQRQGVGDSKGEKPQGRQGIGKLTTKLGKPRDLWTKNIWKSTAYKKHKYVLCRKED